MLKSTPVAVTFERTKQKIMQWSVISAVNDEHVLRTSLLDSPGIRSANEVILQRCYASAASAYNTAIRKASSDLLVFLHQDVYLPEGWIETVMKAMDVLSVQDPTGVCSVYGGPWIAGVGSVTCIGREIMDGATI